MADTASSNTTNPNDPSSFLSQPNVLVKVVNTGRADLNDQLGQVISYNADRNRYTIAMILASSTNPSHTRPNAATALSFKPENLVKANLMERAKFYAQTFKQQLRDTANDPQVQEAMRRAYTSIQTRLPTGVKPEYLLYVLLFLLLVAIRYVGFGKTILFLSLLSMPVVVAAPDLQRGLDVPAVVRAFPQRLRETVVQATGFTWVTERMALGAFVLMFVMSAKVLITPYPTAAPSPPVTGSSTASSAGAPGLSLTVDEIYKWGYEDGKAGKEYGASVTGVDLSDVTSVPGVSTGPKGIDPNSETIDWAYDAPPTPPKRGGFFKNFGVGKIMSMFALFRTLRELAMGPGGYSLDNLTMNLRRLEPWRLGMIAFCLFNVMRGLF